MAGKNSEASPNADFMTSFVLLRQAVNGGSGGLANPYNDVVNDVEELIPLGDSISAYRHNAVALIFRKINGNDGPFDVSLYGTLIDAGSPLKNQTDPNVNPSAVPLLIGHEPSVEKDKIIIFDTNIYASDIRVVMTNVPGAEYDVYASWSGTTKGIRTVTTMPLARERASTPLRGDPSGTPEGGGGIPLDGEKTAPQQ